MTIKPKDLDNRISKINELPDPNRSHILGFQKRLSGDNLTLDRQYACALHLGRIASQKPKDFDQYVKEDFDSAIKIYEDATTKEAVRGGKHVVVEGKYSPATVVAVKAILKCFLLWLFAKRDYEPRWLKEISTASNISRVKSHYRRDQGICDS